MLNTKSINKLGETLPIFSFNNFETKYYNDVVAFVKTCDLTKKRFKYNIGFSLENADIDNKQSSYQFKISGKKPIFGILIMPRCEYYIAKTDTVDTIATTIVKRYIFHIKRQLNIIQHDMLDVFDFRILVRGINLRHNGYIYYCNTNAIGHNFLVWTIKDEYYYVVRHFHKVNNIYRLNCVPLICINEEKYAELFNKLIMIKYNNGYIPKEDKIAIKAQLGYEPENIISKKIVAKLL